MNSKQYTIGSFASMNKVSPRMLRHYDKIGLLRPTSILPNGYRCYSEEQIAIISQIKRLRDCNFLLEEIEAILRNDSPQFLADAAKRKLTQLQKEATQQQTAMQLLRELALESASASAPASSTLVYGVSLTMRRETKLLVSNQFVSLENVESAFDALFRFLRCEKLYAAGCAVLLSRFGCPSDEQAQVGVPIATDYRDEHYHTLTLPSTSVLSVIHYGDYYTIGHAYSALLQYARQNNHPISDLFVERYFLDSSYGITPMDYVTEISVVTKNTNTP